MSLRLQLVALFTAVLAGTLLVAIVLGLRIGQRSVEDEIRKRTAELASATTLALKHAGTDDDQLSEELAGTGRILIRRVSALQLAMRAVEGGLLDVTAPGPAEGGDELAYLSRGFNRMLAQIRGFNAELTGKIEEATGELTKKNRELTDLNELL